MGTSVMIGGNLTKEEQADLIGDLRNLGSKLPKPLTEIKTAFSTNTEFEVEEADFDNAVQLAVSKFISVYPSSREVGDYLAFCANFYCVAVDKTPQWKELSNYYEFKVEDFKNDTDFISDFIGETTLTKLLPYWVYVGK